MDGNLDFTNYSLRELREAEASIDRARFPINRSRLGEEMRKRGLAENQPPVSQVAGSRLDALPRMTPATVSGHEVVEFDTLSKRDQFGVFWGFMWRSLVLSVAAFVVGYLISVLCGILIAFVALSAGAEIEDIKVVGNVVGFTVSLVVGWILAWHFLRWILQCRLGRYRLLLARAIDA